MGKVSRLQDLKGQGWDWWERTQEGSFSGSEAFCEIIQLASVGWSMTQKGS